MEKILYITEFIEGLPTIASTRFEDMMKYFCESYELIIVSEDYYTKDKSIYAHMNFTYKCKKNKFSNSVNNGTSKNTKINNLLRNRITMKIWKFYSQSRFIFNRINQQFYGNLDNYLKENHIDIVFATIPANNILYILEHIKNKHRNIKIICEIRDLIVNELSYKEPKFLLKNMEKLLCKNVDGIIAVSEGIDKYYRNIIGENIILKIIKNGYEDNKFNDCEFKPINKNSKIKFIYMGSLYKGRCVELFLHALLLLKTRDKYELEFNLAGYVDMDCMKEITNFLDEDNKDGIEVNILGTKSHDEAIQLLKENNIAVILTHKRGSEYAIPGKTFEYIGACKPIIAVSQDKGVINIIDGKYGECSEHDIEDIYVKIKLLINKNYNFEDRVRFTRKQQVRDIISFIEEVSPPKPQGHRR